MRKHHIIYLPGIGDQWDDLRSKALSLWALFGVSAELIPMKWYSGGTYGERASAIEKAARAAKNRGQTVTIIGESAGASIGLNELASSTAIDKLVTVSGVVYPETPIAPFIYAKSPAFKTSMDKLKTSVKQLSRRDDVTVITSLYDPIVSHKRNRIDGAKHVRVPSAGHFTTNALCLTIFSPYIIYLIKRSSR